MVLINMRKQKNVDVYIVSNDYCPYCVYFNDMENCRMLIGRKKGLAYCVNYKRED